MVYRIYDAMEATSLRVLCRPRCETNEHDTTTCSADEEHTEVSPAIWTTTQRTAPTTAPVMPPTKTSFNKPTA